MTIGRRKEVVELSWICGQCGLAQAYLPGESPPDKCRDCEWIHKERKPDSVPSTFKININNY